MNHLLKSIYLLAVTCLFSPALFAQAKEWTLKDCIDYAMKNNITIRESALDVQTAGNNLLAAKGGLLPELGGAGSYYYNIGSYFNPVTNGRVNQTSLSNSFSLNAGITLFNGFQLMNNIKKATLDELASRYQLEKTKNDITISIINSYLQLMLNRELEKTAERQLALSQEQVDRLKIQLESGDKSKADMADILGTLASDQQNLVQAQGNVETARLGLAQLLLLPNTDHFEVVTDTAGITVTDILSRPVDTIYREALNTQPDIKYAATSLESSRRNMNIVKSAFFPSLTFGAGMNTTYSNAYTDNNGKTVPYQTQVKDNLGYSFGLSLNVPIFSRLYNTASYRNAKVAFLKSKEQLEQEKFNLLQAIQKVYLNAKLSLRNYESAEQSLQAQTDAFDYTKDRFEAGIITAYDFNQAKSKLLDATGQLLSAKYNYLFNEKLLEFYFTNTFSFIQQPAANN